MTNREAFTSVGIAFGALIIGFVAGYGLCLNSQTARMADTVEDVKADYDAARDKLTPELKKDGGEIKEAVKNRLLEALKKKN